MRRANPPRWAVAASQLHRTVRNAHRARTSAVGIRAEDGGGRWISSGAIRLLTVSGVIVLYFVASATLLWPFVAHPRSTVTAPLGFDVTGSIAHFNAMASEGTSPFVGERLKTIGYPDGVPKRPAIHTASALSSGALWLGSVYLRSDPSAWPRGAARPLLDGDGDVPVCSKRHRLDRGRFRLRRRIWLLPAHAGDGACRADLHTHVALRASALGADGCSAQADAPPRRIGRRLRHPCHVVDAVLRRACVGAFARVRRRRGLSHQKQVGVAAALADARLGRCPGCGGGISLGHARRVPGRGRRGAACGRPRTRTRFRRTR